MGIDKHGCRHRLGLAKAIQGLADLGKSLVTAAKGPDHGNWVQGSDQLGRFISMQLDGIEHECLDMLTDFRLPVVHENSHALEIFRNLSADVLGLLDC
jgi:hypothetical protein